MPKRLTLFLVLFAASILPALVLLPGFCPPVEGVRNGPQRPPTASAALGAALRWLSGGGAPPGVEAASSPVAGEALFQEKGCIACHGDHLQGTDKGPRLTGVGRTLKREQIEHQIRFGGGNMPAFGEDAIAPDELALLVDFLAHQKKRK